MHFGAQTHGLKYRVRVQHVAGQNDGVFLPQQMLEHVLRQNNGVFIPRHVLVMLFRTKNRDFCLRQNKTTILTSKGGQMAVGGHAPERP